MFSPENAVSGDASAQVPGGIRIGTAALTSRDMREDDIRTVANFLHRAVQLSLLLQKESGSKMLKDFAKPRPGQGPDENWLRQLKIAREEWKRRYPRKDG